MCNELVSENGNVEWELFGNLGPPTGGAQPVARAIFCSDLSKDSASHAGEKTDRVEGVRIARLQVAQCTLSSFRSSRFSIRRVDKPLFSFCIDGEVSVLRTLLRINRY